MISEPRQAADGSAVLVESDGATVWVHGLDGTIGRFGRLGIDVHTADTAGCLHCTHGVTTSADWPAFVAKMQEHHGVTVGAQHCPGRFATEAPT